MEREQVLTNLYKKINEQIFHGILPPVLFKIYRGQRSQSGWAVVYQEYNHTYIITVSQARITDNEQLIYSNMFHQIIHILNHEQNILDTSRQGRYHNKKFKLQGEKIGCQMRRDNYYGFSDIVVPDQLIDKIGFNNLASRLKNASENDKNRVANRKGKIVTFYCPVCNRTAKASDSMKLYCGFCNVQMLNDI